MREFVNSSETSIQMVAVFSVKWIVSGSTAVMLLYRRDLYAILFVLGAVMNAIFSKVFRLELTVVAC